MKFFVDTADISEIKDLASTGLLDGVTNHVQWRSSAKTLGTSSLAPPAAR